MRVPDPVLLVALLAACGVFFTGLAGARVRRRRWLAAGRSGAGAGVCLVLAALGIALAFNLYTYRRLTYEQPVARLHFKAIGPERYRAELDTPHAPSRTLLLAGDEWQLDARVLKWRPSANLLGFDALCRLERLSGRYRDVHQENHGPHTARALADEDGRFLSAWQIAQHVPRWAALIDTEYGSAAYLPMADGADYTVVLTQSGLVARPANEAARAATRRW